MNFKGAIIDVGKYEEVRSSIDLMSIHCDDRSQVYNQNTQDVDNGEMVMLKID